MKNSPTIFCLQSFLGGLDNLLSENKLLKAKFLSKLYLSSINIFEKALINIEKKTSFSIQLFSYTKILLKQVNKLKYI